MNAQQGKPRQEMKLKQSLSNQEVRQLAERYAAGDLDAREKLITSHLPLVSYLAQTYYTKSSCLSYEDLYQEGCYGLIQAVDCYDPTRGTQLSSYASYYIVKYFNEAFRKLAPVHIPENIYLALQRYNTRRTNFFRKAGRYPTTEEMSQEMELPIATIRKLQSYSYDFVSLDSEIKPSWKNDGGEGTLYDVVPASLVKRPVEEETMSHLEEINLGNLRVPLTSRESVVLRRRLGLTNKGTPETFKDIAKDFGLSDETIRTTYHSAVEKLRSAAKEQGIDMNTIVL